MKKHPLSVFLTVCGFLGNRFFALGEILDQYRKSPGSIYHGRRVRSRLTGVINLALPEFGFPLLTPRYTRNVPDPHLLVPRRVFHDGNFHTYFLPEYYDRREVSGRRRRSVDDGNEEILHLILPFNGIDHHVELTPFHDFISPEMVIEIRGEGISSDLNKGLRFRRVSDQQCHYRGTVRDHNNSRAALSLCDGVAGYVHTNHGRYFVEPLHEVQPESDGQHVHIAYQRDAPHEKEDSSKRYCGTDDDWESAWAEQLSRKQQERSLVSHEEHKRSDNDKDKPATASHSIHRYVEAGLVADRKFLDFHKDTDYQQYLLTIANMVSDFYHDSSVGNQIDFVVVRMIYLEKEKEEIDLEISPNSDKTLETFANWAMKMNPESHTHPNHHDVGVLITRHDICAEDSGCALMGLAYVSAVCDRPKAACINEDSGLLLGIVVAHEVGHTLGCAHDTEEISGCPAQDKDESYFLMSPYVFIYTLRWSSCSRKFITTLMETGLGDCLTDDPKNPPDKFKYPNMLPGAMYGADFQCRMLFNDTEPCDQAGDCEDLWCKEGDQCMTKGAPPAEGTKCGEKKWCIHKKCVDIGSRPSAVNGGWGEWGKTSECSRTCGGGVKSTERECDKPAPSNGGRYCIGERKRYNICNTTPCDPSKPSFRTIQCEEFNKKEVLSDGLHKWVPYMKEGLDNCKLYCLNEKKVFIELARTAKDGTPCKAGTNDMCISGVCRKVGCDWGLDSDAVEDKCGVCKGNGAECIPVEGDFTKTGLKNYQKVVTVTKASRNIHMYERKPSENILAVKLEKGEKYCLNGGFVEERNGDYQCAGSIIVYTHPETDKEDLLIRGPITEDIQLQYTFLANENPGVHYEYFTNTGSSTYIPKYSWDFLDWSECSAKCAGGTMLSEPTCIEQKSGKVSNSFCSDIPRPEPKSRICNEQLCPAKWRVSQWSRCSACGGNKGFQHRKVQCVKPGAHPGEDDVQSNLDACKGRAPKQKMECVGDRACRKTCKKTREAEKSLAISHSFSLDEQRRLMDQFVDVSLARYLESRGVSGVSGASGTDKSGKRSAVEDFKQLLHEWVASNKAKRKRTCGHGNQTNLSTPKPGSIIKDPAPLDQEMLIVAPFRDDLLRSNMSDLAFQEAGDSVGISIDTKNKKVFKGKEAINMEKKILHHNVSLDLINSSSSAKKSDKCR